MPDRHPSTRGTPDGGSAQRRAIALRYRGGARPAPEVVATGRGAGAERIEQVAREQGVPVREDADLAQSLSHLDIDDLVPSEFYRVIAEVLAWAYRMNHNYLLDSRD